MGGNAIFLILLASLCVAVSTVEERKSETRDELFAELSGLNQNYHEAQDKIGQIGLRQKNSDSSPIPKTGHRTCSYKDVREYGPGPVCPYYYPNCGGWLRGFLGRVRDCQELYQQGYNKTGVYVIFPEGLPEGIYVRCDMDAAGGGWTVIQRRVNGDVDFYRDWSDYKWGFGDLNENFWLGNENIFALTEQDSYEIYIELAVSSRNKSYARYNSFKVGSETNDYLLTLGVYSGTAGDSFSYNSGSKFTTKDRDNDNYGLNCAERFKGGWWYKGCHYANLNGVYGSTTYGKGINWDAYAGVYTSMVYTDMKVRKISSR